MMQIKIFEAHQSCCGASAAENLGDFLNKKFKDEINIEIVNLLEPSHPVTLPEAILEKIRTEGNGCLPSLTIDGKIVSSTGLPNFIDAVSLINKNKKAGVL